MVNSLTSWLIQSRNDISIVIIAFGGIRLLRHFTNARLEVATTIEGDLKNITNHKEAYVISKNLLNRDFHASRSNEKWVTDITYLIFNRQKLFLSAIKDLYNNEIISYQVSRRNDLTLVIVTIKKAKKKRDVKGILLHCDQGYQYTSHQYNNLFEKI
ncbi:DDE-type integrase/transposase/recombinase [Peribacillus sp. ACCC06369]|uniref:DDE-type integrase/transposase/recombinase n=1 Tax=Peribacillus sp. ACCC06369 TaxID=3055860 RepID=UPI0025A0DD8D|nr:DDE-type integrase/transposase/recombinase [Peribacillus sp. ACCC06369]MDM5358737.1 DDE-type integrase/transposase/recombinase [Peribacillus sp. ACCC06369]